MGPRRRDDVFVLSPLVIPAHGSRPVRQLNARLLATLVRRATLRLGLPEPILWAYVPHAEPLIDALRPKRVVYHCVDDIAAHPQIDTGSFREAEARFVARADVVLCSAAPLAERMRTLAPAERVHLMTNVADTRHFAEALDQGPVDPALAALPEPRLVFTGAISAVKVDLELLHELARRRRDWTIALVGPVGLGDPATSVESLAAEPNVHLLGLRRNDELPAVLRGAAVGLIPYRRNALTESIFPMKVYEYLAAGLAVVATRLPSLSDVEGVVLADGCEGFVAAIARALAEDSREHRERQSSAATGHSWEARLREIDDVLALGSV
jgi:glycosyltransferase involved in cell wall biosynthesis